MSRRKAPAQNPGTSTQDVETPRDFLDAVERRWGALDVDLACRFDNAKAPRGIYFDQGNDSLLFPWARDFADLNCWLNPEFGNIEPFAAKCAYEGTLMKRGRIFLLTPAAVGTNWFIQNIYGRAMVLALSPRIQFVGHKQGFPKDLALSIFSPGIHGFGTWRWKGEVR